MRTQNKTICNSIIDAIGNTPLVCLDNFYSVDSNIEVLAKCEFMNPSGSIKDRMVRHMLSKAKENNNIKNAKVVESSSGNTGAALAMMSSIYGYDCEIYLPSSTSQEKINRIKSYGAKVVECPANLASTDENSYYSQAEFAAESSNSLYLNQYKSKLNANAHYFDTAPELWEQASEHIDYFVCGIGSGGTITGVGKFLKEKNPNIQIIGVEPIGSAYKNTISNTNRKLDGFYTKIEGIGKVKPAKSFDSSYVDDVIQISDKLSIEYCHKLASEQGILVGGSSGSVAAGVSHLLSTSITDGRVVTVFPDSGMLYLSKYF